jgi:hypothetical protein
LSKTNERLKKSKSEEQIPKDFEDTKSREDQWALAGKKVDERAAGEKER